MSITRPDLLRLLDLPVFETRQDFLSEINLPHKLVEGIFSRANDHYKRHFISKRNGEKRLLAEPSKTLKAIQAWILRTILDRLHPSQYATAYIQKRTLLHNIGPHVGNRYFICIDVEDFFPSVKIESVQHVLETVGYSTEAATLIAKLCCFRDRLPQGAVTSPSLSNLTCLGIDRELGYIAETRIVTYTRYADDITFSANNPLALRGLVGQVRGVLSSHKFRLNYRKLKILGPSKRCCITGFTKNSSEPRFAIGTAKKRTMRAVMQYIATGKVPSGRYKDIPSIEGWLSFVRGHDRKSFDEMKKYWQKTLFKIQFEKFILSIPVTPPLVPKAPNTRENPPHGNLSFFEQFHNDELNIEELYVDMNAVTCSDDRIAAGITFSFIRTKDVKKHSQLYSFNIQFVDNTREMHNENSLTALIPADIWRDRLLNVRLSV